MYLKQASNVLCSDGFEFLILLPPSSKYWDYGRAPPCPICVMLEMEPALCTREEEFYQLATSQA